MDLTAFIRIADGQPAAADGDYAQQIESLSGIDYPPETKENWARLLSLAGFSQDRIGQVLNELGFPGYEEFGDLPRVYVSFAGQPSDGSDSLLLTQAILAGLEPLRREGGAGQSDAPEPNSSPPDGPLPPDGFRWKGKEFRGLAPQPWRLIDFLWQQKGQQAEFAQLAEPVWRDRAEAVDSKNFGSTRRDANRWLKSHDLPFKVESKSDTAFLKKC